MDLGRVVSLAKAPTDSMTSTTKLAHPFHCLLERVASADRQLFQFRRRYSERFGSIAPLRAAEHLAPGPNSSCCWWVLVLVVFALALVTPTR